jgi:hypothetical protein
VRRLLSGNSMQRFLATVIGLIVIGAVAAPPAMQARGDGATSIAVNAFQNEAGAPKNVVSDLSNALYRAVATSGKYSAKGGGPMAYKVNLVDDPFMDALRGAAIAGADELLVGSVVQTSGGQVFYRLALYRVAPVTFIASQVFSQSYPPADAQALVAGFGNNVATLSAPRQAVGTIYSLVDGVRADLGSSEGFSLGERFNVMRGGQKVAEATISAIRENDASLTISNASGSYQPKVGDKLVGLTPLPPALPAPPTRSTFDPLGFMVAVGGVLLAIGHHGQPGTPGGGVAGPSPSPSSVLFTVTSPGFTETLPTATFTFLFSQLVDNVSQVGIVGNQQYAFITTQPPGSQATTPPEAFSAQGPPPTFTTITGPSGPETQMTFTAQNLVAGEVLNFFFTTTITSTTGQPLAPNQSFTAKMTSTLHRPPNFVPARPGPIAAPTLPKPVATPKVPPKVPDPVPHGPHPPR